ncbi:helix-turn-helix transcriptional regulator [Pseudonocardia sp. MH-G8]|uniref:helix-turn-helix domain-containing protein n=1 Tax=Pseudonocardia sp. MH-G8 TaxID=1854588 RepID=UPI000BA12CF4|nr:helix-turn-helix transcriptional regulator [Pseudonocardia sp. MH-G8]OZM79029.1 transcriptional regulator [Pseudonocardia sp. MH-G8]
MAGYEGSMIRRRILARQLRLLREGAGLTLEEAAPKLHFSVSKLCRIENAQVVIDIHWVKSMLDLYDVGGSRWTELMEIAQEAMQPGWWKAYGLGNSSYIAFETEARRAQSFSLGYVPGVLQIAEYARALMRAVPVRRTAEQLESEVAARLHRQARLTSRENPLELVTVIDEGALRRPIGGTHVWHRQLDRLVELAGLDTVDLRVLPTEVGAHAALASEFTILNFGDLGEPDMAYVEHTLGALSLDKDGDVTRARLTFECVQSDALDPAASVELIRRLAGA